VGQALERMRDGRRARDRRVLVVEGDAGAGLDIVRLSANDDVTLDAVDSGAAALQALAADTYDCAVVDLRLPDMSGLDLLDRIQEQPRLRDLPVVAFTEIGRASCRERG